MATILRKQGQNILGGGGGIGDIDESTLIINDENKVQVNEFMGTSAEFNTAFEAGLLTDNCTVYLTDDGSASSGGWMPHVIISADTGTTVTATKGTTTVNATETSSGVYEMDLSANGGYGTWTFNGTISGSPAQTTADINAVKLYNVAFINGSTVTPTDDVSILLNCAGIYDSEITTLSELLEDTTTLQTVINSNNAIDYLVRSTTFASNVCADSIAMSDIGLNNYASNTLLADSDWLNAICNSTYFESVLNVKVPAMTGYTTPNGEVIEDTHDGGYYGYRAFDGNTDTSFGVFAALNQNHYVGYIFAKQVKLYKCKTIFREQHNSGTPEYFEYKIQKYFNNNWSDATSSMQISISINETKTDTIIFSNPIVTNGLRNHGVSVSSSFGNDYVWIQEIQYYGREDV